MKILRKFLFILFVMFLFVPSVKAGSFYTGNKLYEWLKGWRENSTGVGEGIGFGYVIGIVDSFNNLLFKIPDNATAGQLTDIVYIYLDRNPSIRNKGSNELVVDALIEAYPMPKKSPEKLPQSQPQQPKKKQEKVY